MAEREQSSSGSGIALAAAILCAVTAIAYFPALRNGFAWDDDLLLTQNKLVKSASGLRQFWFTATQADYWPVTYSALWVQWRLWGMHPMGYHAVNVSLHAANSLLLWAVLRRIRLPGSYLAALIYAVHPLNVESVAWISELKNLLAMLFCLASVWFYARPEGDSARMGWRAYGLSLLCFVLAMLSKGSVAILPLILLGIVAWHRRVRGKDVVVVLPFLAIAVVLALTDVWFQGHGTGQVYRNAGFADRLLGAGAAIWFYLGKAAWPANLTFVYPEWHVSAGRPGWWAPLIAAAVLTAVLWRNRGTWSRPALFAWGYFCVALVPVMGFTDVYFMKYSLVADRYAQIAIIGVIAFAAFCAAKAHATERGMLLSRALAVTVVALLGLLTWRQCGMYRDARTLFLATLESNPDCWMACNYLGATEPQANLPESIAYFERALAIKPDYSEARDNLGVALVRAGRLSEAGAQFEEEARQEPGNPRARANLEWVRRLQREF